MLSFYLFESTKFLFEEAVVKSEKDLLKNLKKVKYLKNIDKLGITPNDYIIMASGSCVLYGMPIENHDLDLTMKPEVCERIKNKLLPGEKDGIHDEMFQDKSKTLDINIGKDWGKDFTYDALKPMSIVVGGYRFLTVEGLKFFYKRLYQAFHKDKHKSRLDWLNKNYK